MFNVGKNGKDFKSAAHDKNMIGDNKENRACVTILFMHIRFTRGLLPIL